MKDIITLAHGSGGRLTQELIRNIFLPSFDNSLLAPLTDSAVFEVEEGRIAFTTDSYVIKPLFFPGGDIGKLSISGTINDLAVMGAKPLFISCGFVIEEGFPVASLKKIVLSIKNAAENTGVRIATGDTKVVEKGNADGIFINTSGVGVVSPGINPGIKHIRVGDRIIVSGTVGDHSVAVLSAREELGFEGSVESDCAPVYQLVEKLKPYWGDIRFMRDPTRGGVVGILNEVAQEQPFGIRILESEVPVKEETQALCELLGLDLLYLANEGKVVLFVRRGKAQDVLHALKKHPLGKNASIMGEVVDGPPGKVYVETNLGTKRVVDMLAEDQLPRIC